MPINFLKQQKKQKYLIIIFIIVMLLIASVWWFNLKEKKVVSSGDSLSVLKRHVKIDFELLENPQVKELQSFQKIIPFKGRLGRNNPFLSY